MAYAELHNHTEFSVMDGMPTAGEAARRAAENGSSALAMTDHGGCFGHVQHQRECLAAGISPVFGIETYFQPDRLIRPLGRDAFSDADGYVSEADLTRVRDSQVSLRSGSHLILLAQSDKGLHDLWAASTEAYVSGFYHKPRMDWDLLEQYGGDLIATSACLGGIVSREVAAMDVDAVLAKLDRLKLIFGDRFYLEVQGNDIPLQAQVNQRLAVISDQLGIPMVATCDAHYLAPDDAELHRQWMACQTGKGNDDYWNFSPMLPEQALRESLLTHGLDPAVIDKAIWNTGEIAERCTARISGHADPPVFTPGGTAPDDARALRAMCESNWGLVEHLGRDYRERMEYEFEVVTSKGLAGCYLIVEDIIRFARRSGFLVGPGRGSAAGSLMSYLTGITSVDPIKAGLLFERFLTPGRESLPDFDLDFPTSARTPIQDYAVERYGSDHVVRVGTIMRYGPKGIVKKLMSLQGTEQAQADAVAIGKLVDQAEAGTAGLGLPWDEIMQDPEIAEFRDRYVQLFATAEKLHGRAYALGQHPAGLIISPGKSLTGAMPMRFASTSDRLLVSQWDFRAAEELNLMKVDILTLRNLDSMQEAIRLVAQRTGIRLDPRSWDIEHFDPQVYNAIGTGLTAGVFQLETRLCSEYARRLEPRTLAHLADLTTIIRPGPRNSGAAEKYLARRAGLEEVTYPHPLLKEILGGSYGVLIYQEHVLLACRLLAGYNDLEADDVRKILGKKLTEKIEAAGQAFVRRAVERGHDEEAMTALWADIAEFGKYAFNKAHGFSYGVLSYWTAWMKEHYPAEMLTAIMSTVDMDRLPEFATEARRIGLTVLPPDVRFCKGGFTCEGISVRYGLSAVKGVGPAAIRSVTAAQPYSSYEDFLARSGANAGVVYSLARAGALDALVASRRGLVRVIEADRDGTSVRCVHKTEERSGPQGLPCSYDWSAEPEIRVPVKRKGGTELKVITKPPPKRCTVVCRRYTPPSQAGIAGWAEYAPDALFRQDLDTYGTWMSDAVFGRLDGLAPGLRGQAREMAARLATAVPGSYPAAAVLADVHSAVTRNGNAMWWAKLVTEVSVLDLACFSPRDSDVMDVPGALRRLKTGTLVQAEVVKRAYQGKSGPRMGWRLAAVYPLA